MNLDESERIGEIDRLCKALKLVGKLTVQNLSLEVVIFIFESIVKINCFYVGALKLTKRLTLCTKGYSDIYTKVNMH